MTKERLIKLSWKLLEYKIMYYAPEKIDPSYYEKLVISDEAYDALEEEYVNLCVEHDVENTLSHKYSSDNAIGLKGNGMFEVDFNRPCVKLVLEKYGRK